MIISDLEAKSNHGFTTAKNLVEQAEPPSFWTETLPSFFSENNPIVNSYQEIKRRFDLAQAYPTEAEHQVAAKDFVPLTKESADGIHTRYWDYLAEAETPKDLIIRRNKILREQKDLDIRKRSSGWAYFGAGLIEMWFDPTTYIPIAKTRKYANLLEGFYKNAIAAAPSAFGGAAISNALVIANQESRDVEDWMLETFMQGVLGSAFSGVPGMYKANEFVRARIGMQAMHDDLDLHQVIASKTTRKYKKGEVIKTVGIPAEGSDVAATAKISSQGQPQRVGASTISPHTKAVNEVTASAVGEPHTPSQKRRLENAVKEAEQLQNMTSAETIDMKVKAMQELIDNGIARVGENDFFKWLYKPSPIIKGLTSRFSALREFTNGVWKHNLLLGKMEHPQLKEINTKIAAAKKLKDAAANADEKIKYADELKKLREERKNLNTDEFKAKYEGTPAQQFAAQSEAAKWVGQLANCNVNAKEIWKADVGLSGPLKSNIPFAETAFDGLKKIGSDTQVGHLSFRETMEEATRALRRNEVSTNATAAKIAKMYRDNLYDPLLKELKELGSLPENIDTATAMSYVNRLYNKRAIRAKYVDFVAKLENFYIARDAKVAEIYAPIGVAKQEVDRLKGVLGSSEKARKKLKLQNKVGDVEYAIADNLGKQTTHDLEIATKKLQGLQDKLQHQIDTGTIPLSQMDIDAGITQLSLIDGKPLFTKALKDEHASLTKGLVAAQEKLEAAKATGALPEEIKKLRANIKEQKQLVKNALDQGKVSKELYFTGKKSKKKVLVNIQKKTLSALAKKVKDYEHLAKCIADTITDENSQQIASRMFDGLRGKGKGTPSPLKSRTVLCADHILEEFLINDLSEVAAAHAGNLSNFIALEKFFRRHNTDSDAGKEYFVKKLQTEFDKMREVISRSPDTPLRTKKLDKLQKDFDEATGSIAEFLDVFRGDYERPKSKSAESIQDIINNFKSYAYTTMMGGVALMFQTDIVMPMFKHGFRHVVDGILPVIGQMLDMKLPNHVWGDMGVGLHTTLATLRKQILGEGSQFMSQSPINRLFGNMSKTGSNLFFINQLFDVAENMAASTSASALIRDIEKWASKGKRVAVRDKFGHKTGKSKFISDYQFSKKDLERFQLGRFDVQKHGHAILKMFEKHGEKQYGGFIPNVTAWENTRAADQFRMFIRTEVDHLINRPGKADNPFWFKHPALSLTTQFLSWSFGVTNNITIPMLQRMDQEKLTWMVFAIGLGSLTGPMRQLANGQEVTTDNLLGEGILQSGVFGWQADQLLKLNSVLDIPQLRMFQSDRFKRKSISDLALGPVGGILDSIGKVASMTLNWEINKQDFRKVIRLAPYANCFYLRQMLNDWAESWDMPRKAPKHYYGEEADRFWE